MNRFVLSLALLALVAALCHAVPVDATADTGVTSVESSTDDKNSASVGVDGSKSVSSDDVEHSTDDAKDKDEKDVKTYVVKVVSEGKDNLQAGENAAADTGSSVDDKVEEGADGLGSVL